MPDDRIKISALPSALSLDNTDVLAIVQGMTGDSKETKKVAVTLIAAHLLEVMQHNNLDTSDKTIIGAINEVAETLEGLYPIADASGPIANFSTELARPLEALKVGIVATQEAGTPTPSTPLAISGISSVKVFKRGSNFFDKDTMLIDNAYINDTDGTQRSNIGDKCTDYIEIAPSTAYYILSAQTTGRWGAWYDENKAFISGINLYGSKTSPANAKYVRLTVVRQGNGNPDTFSVNYPATDTVYHAYNPNSQDVTIALGDTYYGGSLTIDKYGHRKIVVTHGYIASYDGETIDEPWISSKDVYEPGATPTAGAQVVYPLTEPIIMDLPDGVPFETLIGVNNIFADSGDILECKYKDTIQHYIDTQIAATQALIL